tara:strand:- start:40 stop:507 length:468 start_codon:yes stop_codon:yes gene_type:complete
MKTYDLLLGGDHRGVNLKNDILNYVSPEHDDNNPTKFDISLIQNLKPHDDKKSVDYPDIVKDFAFYFDGYTHGILVCGSGFGVCMAANRFKYIRAATCRTVKEVELARRHNNINVLCLGADFTKKSLATKMVKVFFETKFEGGRHKRRVNKLKKL